SLGFKGFSYVYSLIRRISSPWKVVFRLGVGFMKPSVLKQGMREQK
ncbi:hypothetical protein EDD64_1641, partial [Effusibacillus lacus]